LALKRGEQMVKGLKGVVACFRDRTKKKEKQKFGAGRLREQRWSEKKWRLRREEGLPFT